MTRHGEMPVRIECTNCYTPMQVASKHAGKRIRCVQCRAPVRVPEPAQRRPVLPVDDWLAEDSDAGPFAEGDDPAHDFSLDEYQPLRRRRPVKRRRQSRKSSYVQRLRLKSVNRRLSKFVVIILLAYLGVFAWKHPTVRSLYDEYTVQLAVRRAAFVDKAFWDEYGSRVEATMDIGGGMTAPNGERGNWDLAEKLVDRHRASSGEALFVILYVPKDEPPTRSDLKKRGEVSIKGELVIRTCIGVRPGAPMLMCGEDVVWPYWYSRNYSKMIRDELHISFPWNESYQGPFSIRMPSGKDLPFDPHE